MKDRVSSGTGRCMEWCSGWRRWKERCSGGTRRWNDRIARGGGRRGSGGMERWKDRVAVGRLEEEMYGVV